MGFYKTHDECEKNAVDLIKKFIKKELNGSLLNLKYYSFWNVAGNKDYDGHTNGPDGDSTKIVYAIDYLLYFENLKDENNNLNLPYFPCEEYYADFKGDTIFTFRTLFSHCCQPSQENPDFVDKVRNFFCIYQYLGSFILIPSKTINKQSLNTYRNKKFNDYFYPFLLQVEEYLNNKDSKGDTTLTSLFNENEFYFKEKNFPQFKKDFYLDKYDFKFEKESYYTYRNKNENDYESFCTDYIDYASKIILQRTSDLVNELNKKLKQYADKTNDSELRSMLYAN